MAPLWLAILRGASLAGKSGKRPQLCDLFDSIFSALVSAKRVPFDLGPSDRPSVVFHQLSNQALHVIRAMYPSFGVAAFQPPSGLRPIHYFDLLRPTINTCKSFLDAALVFECRRQSDADARRDKTDATRLFT